MMTKVALVTNIPAPYREKIHEILSQRLYNHYKVIYCAKKESNRDWIFEFGNYNKCFLKGSSDGFIHNDISVIKHLQSYNPDVLIIMGFYPSMLYAWLWSVFKNKKLIVFTDGTINSEKSLSFIHKVVRRIVFFKTKAFIGPAKSSLALYKSYGIKEDLFFRTYLCVDNSRFYKYDLSLKQYDIMFSGQFIERKMPLFFIEVANYIKKKTGQCKVLILGSGPLKNEIVNKLQYYNIDYSYPGFVQQQDLPSYYALSKVFLFPTLEDPWGVVVNEAMASGLPVITCENAGVANDLVLNNINGFILPLEVSVWAEKVIELVNDKSNYDNISNKALEKVQNYNYTNAANGIFDAIKYAMNIKI